jgi:glucose-6-phosphate 1-epimerase
MDHLAGFAIPDHLRIVPGGGGLPRVEIANRLAAAHIYLHGAHVTHFQPAGAQPVLWLSASSWFADGKPIRGGVPLCWPWFGPHSARKDAPGHGFARLRSWTLSETAQLSDGRTRAVFTLADDAATRALWPHAFRLRYAVTVGRDLELDLRVDNAGDTAFRYEEALHTYLAVDDIRRTTVDGLAGTPYLDKVRDFARVVQDGAVSFSGETDRVYLDTTAACTLADGRRRLVVGKEGSADTVVWNPWIAKAKAMADFGDDEWAGMACVETVNALDHAVVLAPGASHHLVARIGVAG